MTRPRVQIPAAAPVFKDLGGMTERERGENIPNVWGNSGASDYDPAEELFALAAKLDDFGKTAWGDTAWYAAMYIQHLRTKVDKVGKRMYS
jgi:hypothetical protein